MDEPMFDYRGVVPAAVGEEADRVPTTRRLELAPRPARLSRDQGDFVGLLLQTSSQHVGELGLLDSLISTEPHRSRAAYLESCA